ncbi:hypothetical protein AtubIFM54640_000961, partial [Aspergillus tubingensis]
SHTTKSYRRRPFYSTFRSPGGSDDHGCYQAQQPTAHEEVDNSSGPTEQLQWRAQPYFIYPAWVSSVHLRILP